MKNPQMHAIIADGEVQISTDDSEDVVSIARALMDAVLERHLLARFKSRSCHAIFEAELLEDGRISLGVEVVDDREVE
jgi:hypothetical protein